ncbi:DUF5394 family protein [Rickettsia prowazekii]|uniref:Uncharacterized protein RP030 n=2 Tax=Rickettsia prowazekii TaxID=782 RepID=Y030_RICPR|nr:DUF5394 family protein [Rickettsia prowazekii]Q9ZEB5.1 RecName: Full=Uncharacterized protein RP030 [Rickettsia prowazekii str. Madrid E]EOB10149.1 hypothetical protein H376_2970 [Rickettsia prowazekii str. GvF12]ADE29540.1 hypothetical protein rpr22_CDS027 [Rickettsia prowazekii str. Rp22]AFE48860.1 hypothetical protein M9W_00135 [Rickettsia prowazekii str. Chernikova]AFE49705.1 hypothetical protein M9Y_00135 [Rickettsia prowazekii str. Katsinyian]AFE50549.1 hypothetical protein MA1_00135 
MTNNQFSEDTKKIADQIKDSLIGISDNLVLESKEVEEIFEELSKNEEFDYEIERILAILNEQTMDLTQLQSRIILLIRKYLDKTKNLKLKMDEKLINKNVAEVSNYLMHQHSKIVRDANKNLAKPKDKLQSLTKQARMDLKRLIKSFAVYQVYMFMNPKRIAGETKLMNFAYNMIKGGMKLAKKYEGGKEKDIKSYSPRLIKKLEKAHAGFKKNNSISI